MLLETNDYVNLATIIRDLKGDYTMKYMIYDKNNNKPIRKDPYASILEAQDVVKVLVSNELFFKEDLEIRPYVTKIENPVTNIKKESTDVRTRKADKEAVAVMDRQTFISQHLDFFNGKVGSGPRGGSYDSDVSINLVKCVKRVDASIKDFNMVFRNKVWENFTKPCLQFAILENRLYFRDTEKDGIMLSYHKDKPATSNRNVRLSGNIPQAEALKKFVGNHDLKFDNMLKLYFVEV